MMVSRSNSSVYSFFKVTINQYYSRSIRHIRLFRIPIAAATIIKVDNFLMTIYKVKEKARQCDRINLLIMP
jgi:hypothetical protein